jgi:hypothetical protein
MKKTNKNRDLGLAMGMCFGVSIGTALGSSTGNLAMGSCMGLCIGMALGLVLGAKKDEQVNKQLEENDYTVQSVDPDEQTGNYTVTVVNKKGEERVVSVTKDQMEEEGFSKDDAVYLNEDGTIEQAYDKEPE